MATVYFYLITGTAVFAAAAVLADILASINWRW